MIQPARDSATVLRAALGAFDLNTLHPFLVLGHRATNGKVTGGKFAISAEMGVELRSIAYDARARIDTADMAEYAGAGAIDPEEGRWILADHIRDEAPILRFLATIEDQPRPAAEDAQAQGFSSFYAIGFGPADERIYFVRQRLQHFDTGAKLFAQFNPRLEVIRKPIVSFDKAVDFIWFDEGAVLFSGQMFERFIQDPVEITGAFDASVDALAARVAFDPDSLAMLKQRGANSTRMRGRVRSILARRYLANVSIATVEEKLVETGLEVGRFVAGGALKFAPKDALTLLNFLDQKVWKGAFDGETYSTNSATPAP